VIIREGDEGDCFYMIESGRCSVTILGSRVNELGPGDSFGSIALLKDIPRTATVTALEDMELFGLERQPFLEAVAGYT
jgi:CRP-like cAMP-binding protein